MFIENDKKKEAVGKIYTSTIINRIFLWDHVSLKKYCHHVLVVISMFCLGIGTRVQYNVIKYNVILKSLRSRQYACFTYDSRVCRAIYYKRCLDDTRRSDRCRQCRK